MSDQAYYIKNCITIHIGVKKTLLDFISKYIWMSVLNCANFFIFVKPFDFMNKKVHFYYLSTITYSLCICVYIYSLFFLFFLHLYHNTNTLYL